MAILEHPETGERKVIDGELPPFSVYGVDKYDEESSELMTEERIDFGGESWIVVDDGVDMVEIGENVELD